MLEQLRRKNLSSSAEATFEVGRLYYLLGRRDEGMRKFDEAHRAGRRPRSNLPGCHRVLGSAGRDGKRRRHLPSSDREARSFYLRVRQGLRVAVDRRPHTAQHQRPRRGRPELPAHARRSEGHVARNLGEPPWYAELAKYAVGEIDYAALLGKADTVGKRAEAYFYEAMRRLSIGQRDEAHAPVEQGGRNQDVVVLRVRDGLALSAHRRPSPTPRSSTTTR